MVHAATWLILASVSPSKCKFKLCPRWPSVQTKQIAGGFLAQRMRLFSRPQMFIVLVSAGHERHPVLITLSNSLNEVGNIAFAKVWVALETQRITSLLAF